MRNLARAVRNAVACTFSACSSLNTVILLLSISLCAGAAHATTFSVNGYITDYYPWYLYPGHVGESYYGSYYAEVDDMFYGDIGIMLYQPCGNVLFPLYDRRVVLGASATSATPDCTGSLPAGLSYYTYYDNSRFWVDITGSVPVQAALAHHDGVFEAYYNGINGARAYQWRIRVDDWYDRIPSFQLLEGEETNAPGSMHVEGISYYPPYGSNFWVYPEPGFAMPIATSLGAPFANSYLFKKALWKQMQLPADTDCFTIVVFTSGYFAVETEVPLSNAPLDISVFSDPYGSPRRIGHTNGFDRLTNLYDSVGYLTNRVPDNIGQFCVFRAQQSNIYAIKVAALSSTNAEHYRIRFLDVAAVLAQSILLSNGLDLLLADPVAPFDGRVRSFPQHDFVVKDPAMPMDLFRTYDSTCTNDTPFGLGWTHSYNIRLASSDGRVTISGADGLPSSFVQIPSSRIFLSDDERALHLNQKGENEYTLLDEGLATYTFSTNGLTGVADKNGNAMTFSYDGDILRRISNATASITFSNNADGRVTHAWDSFGRTCRYAYADNCLTQAVDVAGNATYFFYDPKGRMARYVRIDCAAIDYEYDASNRCVATRGTDGYFDTTFGYSEINGVKKCVETNATGDHTTYTFKRRGMVEKTEYSDGSYINYDHSGVRRTKFTDENGNTTTRILSKGQVRWVTDPKGNTTTHDYIDRPGSADLLNSVVNACGETTSFSYDSRNNVTLVRKGTTAPTVEETHFSYDSHGRLAAAWNALGHVQTNKYTDQGRLRQTIDPLGRMTRFTYDARGNLTNIVNPRRFNTGIAYDIFDRPIATTSPDGSTSRIFYDKSGRVAAVQDALGSVVTNTYNAFGLQTGVADPLGNSVATTYDRMGRPTSSSIYDASDSSTHTSSNVYNLRGRLVETIDPLDNETKYNYDGVGNLTAVTNALGAATTLRYDKNYNLTLTVDPLGRETAIAYDAANRAVHATNALDQIVGITTYDAVGRVSTVKERQGDPITTTFGYDLAGRRTGTTVSGEGFNLVSTIKFDAVGQVTNTIDPAGYKNAFTYDLAGNMTRHVDENGHASTFTYDSMNRLAKVTDPLGTFWTNAYDRMGNVVSHLPSYCDADTFQHDALGRVTQMTSPAGSFSCTYNAANQVKKQVFDDCRTNEYAYDAAYRLTNASSVGAGSSCVRGSYAYDAVGNVTNISTGGTQAPASTLAYAYDAANQNTSRSLYLSNLVVQDAYQYDALGRLTAITNGFVTAQYVYDEAGNLTSKTVAVVGNSVPVVCGYGYDALDRLTNLVSYVAGGEQIDSLAYTYEANRSLITGITAANSASHSFAYDPARQLVQGNTNVYRYDAAGRLTGVGTAGMAFVSHVITYGPGNQVGSVSYPAANTVVNLDIECQTPANVQNWLVEANGVKPISSNYTGSTTTFTINDVPLSNAASWATVKLDEQESAQRVDGWNEWANHQPATNLELHFKVESATVADEGVFPVAPVTNTAYTYDAGGQLTNKTVGGSPVSYAYDSARNMTRCQGAGFTNQYFYDHARRLICQVSQRNGTIESNRYVYDGMDMIASVDEVSGEVVYFTRGLGIALGVGDVLAETHILGSLTQTYVYVQNHRGDTIALVDGASGTIAARYEYSAWGEIAGHTGSNAFFTFSGKHLDDDAGLYYYGFRWYDAVAKRWTQPDPMGLSEGLDLYRFCGNDPVNAVDPYGNAAVYITYIDFTDGKLHRLTLVNKKATEIYTAVNKLPDFSVVSLTIAGHADIDAIETKAATVEPYGSSREVLFVCKSTENWKLDFARMEMSPSGIKMVPLNLGFGSLLQNKLLPMMSTITLNGCHTALGEDNIARNISKLYPSSYVIGNGLVTFMTKPDPTISKSVVYSKKGVKYEVPNFIEGNITWPRPYIAGQTFVPDAPFALRLVWRKIPKLLILLQ